MSKYNSLHGVYHTFLLGSVLISTHFFPKLEMFMIIMNGVSNFRPSSRTDLVITILGSLEKLQKAIFSIVMCVRPPLFGIKQRGPHWMDFHEI